MSLYTNTNHKLEVAIIAALVAWQRHRYRYDDESPEEYLLGTVLEDIIESRARFSLKQNLDLMKRLHDFAQNLVVASEVVIDALEEGVGDENEEQELEQFEHLLHLSETHDARQTSKAAGAPEKASEVKCSSGGGFGYCRDERDPELCANCERTLIK